MKKYLIPIFVSAALAAECKPLVEAKAGYFFFTDSTLKKVYKDGGLDLQLSESYPIWDWLHIYGSVEYATRHGHSLGQHQKTTFQQVPLSLGLKPVFSVSHRVDYYFTLGPRYSFAWARNSSSFVDHRVSGNGIGLFANTGFLYKFENHFTFNLFGEYSYVPINFHASKQNVMAHRKNVGGWTFGGGLGWSF